MRFLRCASILALTMVSGFASAQEKKPDAPEFTLGQCIEVAVDRQPALKAVRASQDASAIGRQALHNIGPLGSLLSRDLPVRKTQADRGLTVAEAEVQKVYSEVVHDVTRLYWSVLYARKQSVDLEEVVEQIEVFKKSAKSLLDSDTPGEMTQAKYDTMIIALAKVKKLHGKAATSEKQAMAALREAMGVLDGSVPFRVKETGDEHELPVMDLNVKLTKEQVVEMALSRRPEITMAQAGAGALKLEACAQDRVRFRRKVPTMTSGADIHARLFPTGSRDPGHDYRPEPILPEMPSMLVGRRSERVARAAALGSRADSVVEKARNLIILEAENALLDFEEAAKNVTISKESRDAAMSLKKRIQSGFDNPKAAKDQLIVGYGQAAESIAEYNQAVFQYLLEMTAMERVTAGGVRPAFPGR